MTLEGKRHITPLMWKNFESDFAFKAARVGDVTNREMEERRLLQLPPDLRLRLREENYRVTCSSFWVRIQEPPPFGCHGYKIL